MAESVSFRDLVLDERQIEGLDPAPSVPPSLSDWSVAWPELETVASSNADAVMVHRGDDGDQLVVLLGSRGLAYERDAEGLDPPRRLDAASLDRHLQALGSKGSIEVVPWSTPFVPGVQRAERMLSLMGDPTFAQLARAGQVRCEYGSAAAVAEASAMARVLEREGKGVIKALVGTVANHLDLQAAATAMGLALGLWDPWVRQSDVAVSVGCSVAELRDAVDVFTYPDAFVRLSRDLGLDTARSYLDGFLSLRKRGTWEAEQASLADLLDTLERLEVKVKPKAFVSYAIVQRAMQAQTSLDAARWLDTWSSCLALQDLVHGRIEDKYPSGLLERHDVLLVEGMRARHALSADDECAYGADPFVSHRDELQSNAWQDERYLIRPPRDAEEMLFEAREQSNCLATYVQAFEHGDTDIYLMREAAHPEVPCVTVEVRGGAVRQAFRARNERMTPEQSAWLASWCDSHGISRLRGSNALYVGLRYEDAEDEAERMDVRRNRPRTMRT